MLNMGAPQGFVLSSFPFTLHMHDCNIHPGVKFVDDPTASARLQTTMRTHIQEKSAVNKQVNKTNPLIVDLQRRQRHTDLSSSVQVKWSG